VRPLEPLADGFAPGFVFEGQGRFIMEIPDAFEVEQLRRFAARGDLGKIDQPFTRLVLRSTSDLPGVVAPAPAGASYQAVPLLKDRNEEWLRYAGFDPDARLVAGHLTPGDDYLLVDVETADLGWLSFEFEPWDQEEVHLIKLQHLNDWPETWVSLDRASERDGQGKPTSVRKAGIDITFATIDVDVSKHQGSRFDPDDESTRDWTVYAANVAFLPQREGARAVRLSLDPSARVTRVATGEGVELRQYGRSEPYAYGMPREKMLPQIVESETAWLKMLHDRCKELGTRAPITVGIHPGVPLELVEPISDVLSIHPYFVHNRPQAAYVLHACEFHVFEALQFQQDRRRALQSLCD